MIDVVQYNTRRDLVKLNPGKNRTISSVHAGEATPMTPNFAPSVLIVRLLRIVLLYLLYKRIDSFSPCRIPCAMLILSVRLLSQE
jgi:hypothetical protein